MTIVHEYNILLFSSAFSIGVGVVSVVVSWACNGLAVRYYVNFCLWVLEAQESTRNDWHGIQLVVHASEVRHLVERVRFLSRLIAN